MVTPHPKRLRTRAARVPRPANRGTLNRYLEWRRITGRQITALGLALFLALSGHYLGLWLRLELAFYDVRQYLGSPIVTADSNTALVTIDDKSLQEIGRWPWPRTQVAQLVDQLGQLGAKVIVVDILFSEHSSDDQVLAKSFGASRVVLPYYITSATDKTLLPVSTLREHASLGHGSICIDIDGTVRRLPAMLYSQHTATFPWPLSVEATRLFLGIPSNQVSLERNTLRIGPLQIPLAGENILLNFPQAENKELPWPSQAIYSARDVLGGKVAREELIGKVVFVGVTAAGIGDRYKSPVPGYGTVPGVVFHATAAENLLSGSWVRPASPVHARGFLLLVVALQVALVVRSRLSQFLVGSFALTIGCVTTALFQSFNRIWMPIMPAIAFIALNSFGQTIATYSDERKKREKTLHSLSRYFPQTTAVALVEAQKSPFEAREVDGAVLFADLVGFTSHCENSSPEEVVRLLNNHFEIMEEAVFSHQGALDKFTGDGVMALFGLVGTANPVDAALAAAWEIKTALGKLAGEDSGEWLNVSLGVAAGKFFVGDIGTSRRADYTAVGDTVNTAARLEDLAKPGEVLVTGKAALASKQFAFTFVGEVTLRGKTKGEPIYRLLGPKECIRDEA